MNWEEIGAIGELIGAATVVATLLYSVKQTPHTSTSSGIATIRS